MLIEKHERKIKKNVLEDNFNIDLTYCSDKEEIYNFFHSYFDIDSFLEIRKKIVYFTEISGWYSNSIL